jgi:uncharacterized membrane protein
MSIVDRTPSEPLTRLVNPALLEHARQRRQSLENRVADHITEFSGSMRFVYLHVIWFTCWIAFGVEPYPYGLLTMIVSLEAIFLSTFVMISQNRADAKREVLANQQWATVKDEDEQNQELLALSHQILALTQAVHSSVAPGAGDTGTQPGTAGGTQNAAAPDTPQPGTRSRHG